MKKHLLLALFLSFFIVSCEKDDDHDHDECHECHLELMINGSVDHSYEIGEFCGEALHEIEENGFVTEGFTHMEVDFEAGTYTNVHCEEHAHDDH